LIRIKYDLLLLILVYKDIGIVHEVLNLLLIDW